MKVIRTIRKVWRSRPTIEGAGVHLKRAFGNQEVPLFDPFLLLDDFRSDDPPKYLPGFPWHPHRGIETITYVLQGDVEHGDSMGNRGVITPGDVQWMTAGSGIIHQEMPKGDAQGRMGGFQLWANLPASHKMMDPRYRDVKRGEIPEVVHRRAARRRRSSADGWAACRGRSGTSSPTPSTSTSPSRRGSRFTHPVKSGHTVFAYVIQGRAYFDPEPGSVRPRGSRAELLRHGAGLPLRRRKTSSSTATATPCPSPPKRSRFAFFSCPANRSASRSPGTAPS